MRKTTPPTPSRLVLVRRVRERPTRLPRGIVVPEHVAFLICGLLPIAVHQQSTALSLRLSHRFGIEELHGTTCSTVAWMVVGRVASGVVVPIGPAFVVGELFPLLSELPIGCPDHVTLVLLRGPFLDCQSARIL